MGEQVAVRHVKTVTSKSHLRRRYAAHRQWPFYSISGHLSCTSILLSAASTWQLLLLLSATYQAPRAVYKRKRLGTSRHRSSIVLEVFSMRNTSCKPRGDRKRCSRLGKRQPRPRRQRRISAQLPGQAWKRPELPPMRRYAIFSPSSFHIDWTPNVRNKFRRFIQPTFSLSLMKNLCACVSRRIEWRLTTSWEGLGNREEARENGRSRAPEAGGV